MRGDKRRGCMIYLFDFQSCYRKELQQLSVSEGYREAKINVNVSVFIVIA